MARAVRIALDLALISIKTVRPVVSKIWTAAKSKALATKARPLVDNVVVSKIESGMGSLTSTLLENLSYLRERQLPGEQRYLEKELERVKKELKEGSPFQIEGEKDSQYEKK